MHRLPVLRHRTARPAWAKYRSCRHPAERTHWHPIRLLLRTDEPWASARAAAVVGVSAITARAVLQRWNADGPGGLADRRAKNHGPSALTGARRGKSVRRPEEAATRRGLWTGPKVAWNVNDWWRCGWPRGPGGGGWWNLGSPRRCPARPARRPPGRPSEVENATRERDRPASAGPTRVRRWRCGPRTRPGSGSSRSLVGSGPRRAAGPGRARYDWRYAYGFAHPRTGQTFCVLLPRVDAGRMGGAPAAFATHADPDGQEVSVVPVDNAGWHVAERLVVPPNVVLHVPPPRTPELRPAEPLWPLAREAVADRSIGRIDRVRAILRARLGYLARTPEVVQPVIGFRWVVRLER